MNSPVGAGEAGAKPLKVSRVFPAPRELLFRAWSSAEHVKNWFTPPGMSTPHCDVGMRVGGPFVVCMQMPDGTQHWARGTFVEVAQNERLVIDMRATDTDGRVLFRAHTEVTFSDAVGGTRLDVVQTYSDMVPGAEMMIAGAPQGWAGTLDNLGAVVARLQAPTSC
jgi:uncharacterized protein YndB with AHSA1/START domain